HGLATPGFVIPTMNGVLMLTGGATLPAGAALLTLAAFGLPRRAGLGVKHLIAIEAVLLLAILGLGASAIVSPSLVPPVPAANSPAALALLAVSLLLFLLPRTRPLRTLLLTPRLSALRVLVGVAWLARSLVASLTLTYAQLGWWLGHGLELDGILAVGIPVALDLARSVQSRPLAGDLHASDLVLAGEAFLG